MKVPLNNSSINYLDHNPSHALPIILIHGFPFSLEMWEPQVTPISKISRLITYDIRGHGASSPGDGQYTIELFVDDLIALMTHLSLRKAILCGLSMGGYIALRAYERHPDKISGLILCDTKSEPDTNEARIKRASSIKAIKDFGIAEFADEFIKTIFWEKTFENKPELVRMVKQIICKNTPLGICGALLALASRTDTTQSMGFINVPTCIIVGEYDRLISLSNAQAMHKSIIGSELHVIPESGHLSNLENDEEFNKRLIDFIKKHW
jgi:3-oxoadipate enol-lactonase